MALMAPPTWPVGRRLVGELGMVGFEGTQLAHERVEVGVADLGRVERVVPLVVVGDLGPERLDPLRRVDRIDGVRIGTHLRPAQAPSDSRVAAD